MKRILVLVVVVFLTAMNLCAQGEDKNFPKTVNYTGNLFDKSGKPINKAVDLNFKFFNSKTSDSLLWTESHKNVQIKDGYFSVNLGTETPLHLDFSKPLWIELTVDNLVYLRVTYPATPLVLDNIKNYKPQSTDLKNRNDSIVTSKKFNLKDSIANYGTVIPVDEPPKVNDYRDLQNCVIYPEICKRSCRGTVIIAVWIDRFGKPHKAKIIDSPNSILDQASIDAVMKYTGYTPAMQKGKPVGCWLQLPITYDF